MNTTVLLKTVAFCALSLLSPQAQAAAASKVPLCSPLSLILNQNNKQLIATIDDDGIRVYPTDSVAPDTQEQNPDPMKQWGFSLKQYVDEYHEKIRGAQWDLGCLSCGLWIEVSEEEFEAIQNMRAMKSANDATQ